MTRGWWNLPCWNGLSEEQQRRLVEHGNLPMGFEEEGECDRGAAVAIELPDDEAPGPRFYCLPCAVQLLATRYAREVHPTVMREVGPLRSMDDLTIGDLTDEEARRFLEAMEEEW